MPGKNIKFDPLFELFEHHLLNRSYEDAKKFTKELAMDYLSYLDSTPAHVPFQMRTQLLEDLESEAHEMLVKKMYGCVSPNDYRNSGKVARVRVAEEMLTIEFSALPAEESNKS